VRRTVGYVRPADEFCPAPLLYPAWSRSSSLASSSRSALSPTRSFAWWYLAPRLRPLPQALALVPLLWVHVPRIVGGTILAPGSVDAAVPADFRAMIGYGDMVTAVLALLAIVALTNAGPGAIALVWLMLAVARWDTVNAIIQSLRYSVFNDPLGLNWVTVTAYVARRSWSAAC